MPLESFEARLVGQLGTSAATAAGAGVASTAAHLWVEVTNPRPATGGALPGLTTHAVYTVTTQTSLGRFKATELRTTRRYSDFVTLRGRLRAAFPGLVVPPLPAKQLTLHDKFDPRLLDSRRRLLGLFLQRLCAHPTLRETELLQFFLEATPAQWAAGSTWSETTPALGAVARECGGVFEAIGNWFEGLGVSVTVGVSNLQAGESLTSAFARFAVDGEEDEEAARHLVSLEDHLGALDAAANSIAAVASSDADSLEAMCRHLTQLSEAEERGAELCAGDDGKSFGCVLTHVDAQATEVVQELRANALALSTGTFAEAVNDLRLTIVAVREAISDLMDVKGRLELELQRHAAVERQVRNGGSARLETSKAQLDEAQAAYDEIRERVHAELPRVREDMSRELSVSLRAFANAILELGEKSRFAWAAALGPGGPDDYLPDDQQFRQQFV